jgi:hypothetical protein
MSVTVKEARPVAIASPVPIYINLLLAGCLTYHWHVGYYTDESEPYI